MALLFQTIKTFFFSQLSLTHMMQLDDEKGEGFTHNTFKHFVINSAE